MDYVALPYQPSDKHNDAMIEPPILIPASCPAPCVTLESDLTPVGPCSSALISYYRADYSSKIIWSHRGLMLVAKGWTRWFGCPFMKTTDYCLESDLCRSSFYQPIWYYSSEAFWSLKTRLYSHGLFSKLWPYLQKQSAVENWRNWLNGIQLTKWFVLKISDCGISHRRYINSV